MFTESWTAYEEGKKASKEHDSDPTRCKNPHPKGTVMWRSWNAGWNSHFDLIWCENKRN